MLLGGLMMVIGSVTPWVMTPLINLNGMAGAGLWTLSAGFIAIAGALIPNRTSAMVQSFAPGGLAALIVAWQFVELIRISAVTGTWGKLLPGIGLVLIGGAAVVLLRTGFRIRAAT
jgi:hypothetical protein